MSYIFKGRLCGFICDECPEPLSDVTMRLYRHRGDQNVTSLAVASPKDTFAILTDDQVKEKAGSLIAEARTDANGAFSFELGEKERYNGEAFEVDVWCATVPHRKPGRKTPPPLQISITSLQPAWRPAESGFIGAWEYCIPARYWCPVRLRFGAWTICGQVTVCGTKDPVGGVKVTAFDRDWIQDDHLGSAMTDGAGKFRIDYLAEDFKKTPFSPLINFECVGGPDLYFKIESAGGTVLLSEPPSRGRDADRENVGPCFCVDLCVDTQQPGPSDHPWFTNVGDFNILSDINHATDGKTAHASPPGMPTAHGGPDFGFYDGPYGFGLKLIGFCPKVHPVGGLFMRYRFMYEDPANNPGVKVPLTGALVSSVVVGSRPIMWDLFGTGLVSTFQSIVVAGSGATPDPTPPPSPMPPPGTPWPPVPQHVIVPDADGWVKVDQTAFDGGFFGPLIRFYSRIAVPGGAAPGSGAGTLPASPKNGVVLKLYFEAEPVGGPSGGSTTLGNNLDKILINNWAEVNELNLKQFMAPGADCCTPLSSSLDILYTADHELMKSWGVTMGSCAASKGWSPPAGLPGGSVPRGGAGDFFQDVSSPATWPGCSYRVDLSTTRAVTDGETDDFGSTSEITFCICR